MEASKEKKDSKKEKAGRQGNKIKKIKRLERDGGSLLVRPALGRAAGRPSRVSKAERRMKQSQEDPWKIREKLYKNCGKSYRNKAS